MSRILPPANLHERAVRTRAVLAKFQSRPFDWASSATCIHLGRAQAIAFGNRWPSIPAFRSELGARRELRKLGHANMTELLDSLLPGRRIGASSMWIGDIALLDPLLDGGLEPITIYIGGSHVKGWHGSDLSRMHSVALSRLEFGTIVKAWRL